MGIERMVTDLYKFLKSDVTDKQLFEATDKAYKSDTVYLKESKLPADLSQIKDPKGEIQSLSEEKKEKETSGDVKPAEQTDEVALSKVEKDAEKKTENIDKLTDPQAAVKAAEKMKEGKLPADLSQVKNPDEEVYQLAEGETEEPLTALPDEDSAKRVVNKVGTGKSRYEKNQKGQFTVYTKETKACKDCDVKVTGVKVEGAKSAKDVIKKQQESKKIKEETTTEMPAPAIGKVPNVKANVNVDVPVSPVVSANPDNKDGSDVKGEVNVSADADKVANANPDNKDSANIVKEDIGTSPDEIDPIKQGPDKGEQQTKKSDTVSNSAGNDEVANAGPTVAGDAPKDIDPVKQGADKGEKQTQASQSTSKKNENTTTEPTKGEVKAKEKVPEVDATTKTDVNMKAVNNANPDNKDKAQVAGEVNTTNSPADKVANANPDNKNKDGLVSEEVDVVVTADGQGVTVTQDDAGATTVTTNPSVSAEVVTDVSNTEHEMEETPEEEEFEEELAPEELEVAEKLFLADYLKGKKQLSEKERKFIKETRSIKLPKKAWERVHAKVATLKGKK